MSLGGHVNDMINRVKQNAALKDARRRKFKGGNDYSHVSRTKTEYNFPKLSQQGLQNFKLKVKDEARKEKIKQLLFWSVIVVVLVTLIILNYF